MDRGEALARTIRWERARAATGDPAGFDYAAEDRAAMSYSG